MQKRLYLYEIKSINHILNIMADEKKSILKEALTDFNEIMEAATNKAKTELANEFPEKFNNLIKEELKSKKPIKDSYKKIITEEPITITEEKTKEPIMEKNTKETKKVVKEGLENAPFDNAATKPEVVEEFNISELDMSAVGTALENAGDTDEVITMNEIQQELANMDLGAPESIEGDDSLKKLYELKNQLLEIINGLNGENKFDINKVSAPVEPELTEEAPITDNDITDVLAGNEPAVDEAHGLAYSTRRQAAGRHLPDEEHLSAGEKDQSPYLAENKKKISGLIKENMGLTKKLNEAKKYKDTVGELLENYNIALGKYRTQLKEMAIFNTNLAHVNNLLVNEELALTQEDKVKIITEFKNIDNIAASQSKYKTFLTEIKESRKTITESIEDKVTTSIQPSSKQKLDEVVEKTAYSNDAHINKMKKLIQYVENRGKK